MVKHLHNQIMLTLTPLPFILCCAIGSVRFSAIKLFRDVHSAFCSLIKSWRIIKELRYQTQNHNLLVVLILVDVELFKSCLDI